MVSDQEVVTAGKYLGADFVVVTKVQKVGETYFISAKMITVKTGVIASQSSSQGEGKLAVLIGLAEEVGDVLAGSGATGGKAAAAKPSKGGTALPPAQAPSPAGAGSGQPMAKVLPIVLNLVPGFGVGSFVQGDKIGGYVGLGVTLIGDALILSGSKKYSDAMALWNSLGKYYGDPEPTDGLSTVGFGLLLIVGADVYGVIRPINVANDYNRQHGLASVSVAPTISASSAGGRKAAMPGAIVRLSF
jgi:hypothetical protein